MQLCAVSRLRFYPSESQTQAPFSGTETMSLDQSFSRRPKTHKEWYGSLPSRRVYVRPKHYLYTTAEAIENAMFRQQRDKPHPPTMPNAKQTVPSRASRAKATTAALNHKDREAWLTVKKVLMRRQYGIEELFALLDKDGV